MIKTSGASDNEVGEVSGYYSRYMLLDIATFLSQNKYESNLLQAILVTSSMMVVKQIINQNISSNEAEGDTVEWFLRPDLCGGLPLA